MSVSSSGPDPAGGAGREDEGPPALFSPGSLSLRLLTASILGPLVLAIVYFGEEFTDFFFTAIAAVMTWEWSRLCGEGRLERAGQVAIMAVTASLVAAVLGRYEIGGWLMAMGAMGAAVTASRSGSNTPPFWYALGVAYISTAGIALVWLREFPEIGRDVLFWLLLVIWATDSGAYAAGRTIGGPKLAPVVSPNKTWAGLIGGMASAAAISVAAGWLRGIEELVALAAMGAVLAVVSQGGDLFISVLKRRFGAKDTSNLVPGHGDVLDRADSLLAGALAVAVMLRLKGTLI